MRDNPPAATVFYLVELSNPTEIEIVQRQTGKNRKIQQINVRVWGNSCKPTVSIYKKEII